jgi:uncharacterized protein YeaO (DUF488 family)
MPLAGRHVARIGRVYDPRTRGDGRRVLVDGLWPRGMSKERADIDEWCKQIAPSAALREWYGHDASHYREFARRYQAELKDPMRAEALEHLRSVLTRRALTLLTATRDQAISHAAVLAILLNDA